MFIVNWLCSKLGFMPKIDMEVGKVNLEVKPCSFAPEVEVKSLAEEPVPIKKPRVRKTRPLPSRATKAKTAIKTARAKKVK
jgi:hypothetical protein